MVKHTKGLSGTVEANNRWGHGVIGLTKWSPGYTNSFSFELIMPVRIWTFKKKKKKNILEFNQIIIFKIFFMKQCIWVIVQELDLNYEATWWTLFQWNAGNHNISRLSWPDITDNCQLPFTWVSLLADQDLDAKIRNPTVSVLVPWEHVAVWGAAQVGLFFVHCSYEPEMAINEVNQSLTISM